MGSTQSKDTMYAANKSDTDNLPIAEYKPYSSFRTDLTVLRYMWFAKIAGGTHQDKLESFYKNQASLYDSYRYRMLHARKPMISNMPTPKGGIWIDMGGGTGSNLEYFGDKLNHFSKVIVLDLCPSLAEEARARNKKNGWSDFVDVLVADACDSNAAGLPERGTVDVITFSYAITMIPDWKGALQNAYDLLKPGGHICVCDFTVDDSQWIGMSSFWRNTFATDHVFLRAEHRPYLASKFTPVYQDMGYGSFPYVPSLLKCPWYVFIGQKKAN